MSPTRKRFYSYACTYVYTYAHTDMSSVRWTLMHSRDNLYALVQQMWHCYLLLDCTSKSCGFFSFWRISCCWQNTFRLDKLSFPFLFCFHFLFPESKAFKQNIFLTCGLFLCASLLKSCSFLLKTFLIWMLEMNPTPKKK